MIKIGGVLMHLLGTTNNNKSLMTNSNCNNEGRKRRVKGVMKELALILYLLQYLAGERGKEMTNPPNPPNPKDLQLKQEHPLSKSATQGLVRTAPQGWSGDK